MAALGMRGTGSFTALEDRPKNWREGILLAFPNASAPLTAFLSKLPDEQTDDAEFFWFEKGLPSGRAIVSGSQASGDTTIELATAADNKKFKAGHIVVNERTLELVLVVDSSVSGVLEVVRSWGSVAAATMNNGDGILTIGSAHEEGADAPEAVSYDPTKPSNYTQIFRNVNEVTGTAKETNIRYGDGQYLKEGRRETLELHSIEMERAFLFGDKVEVLTGSQPKRSTGGLTYFLTTNVKDFADAVDIDSLENWLEDVFETGSSEKLALVGNRALNVFNKVARNNYTITNTPTSETYGMKMVEWVTPYGVLYIKQHPLLSENATFNDWGFVIDPKKVKYRYLRNRDTQYLENIQNPESDSVKSEFRSECGLEINHEYAHAYFKNASAFAA